MCVGAEDDDGEKAVGRTFSKPLSPSVLVNATSTPVTVKTTLATPNKTDAAVAKIEEKPKSGGFGVKKVVKEETSDEWS
jgi:hypothetical protein